MAKQKYPMKAAAMKTRLSPHVIRVWERRYEAVKPERTPTNRRLYSEEDIERLMLLRKATMAGHSIGQVARLSLKALRELIREQVDVLGTEALNTAWEGADITEEEVDFESMIQAVEAMDLKTLERSLSKAALTMSRPSLMQDIVTPLMHKVGEMWADGSIRVAHEHMTTAAMRSFFGKLKEVFDPPESAPLMIVTTPIGQNHEVGALIAEAAALSVGWRVIYLGPNLPAEEIAVAARLNKAAAVALSIVYPPDDPRIPDELRSLRKSLPVPVSLFVGGRASEAYGKVIQEIGAQTVHDLSDFYRRLEAQRAS
ncbi:MAG: MerR family transcriptional regulator [Planctomycetota bacterium]|jgi:methanogenic corrinoid protein MtbC1